MNSYPAELSVTVRKICLGLFVLASLSGGQVLAQLASGSGPISGYHGNTADCSDCHFGGSYSPTATITAPTSVVHGATSSTFTLAGSGGAGRGFNIAIYNPSGTKVNGGFSSLSSGIFSPPSGGELQHGVVQTGTSWTFQWSAPSTLGTYTVYTCVNPVDISGTEAGDGPPACDTDTFIVSNNRPNADNDSESTPENGTTGTFNVLTNDDQTEGDAFTWLSTNTSGLTGSLTDNSNGTYNYNPNGQFESLDSGETDTDTFTYTIRETAYTGADDCGLTSGSTIACTDTATVTITINGANDTPVADNEGNSTTGFTTVLEGGSISPGSSILTGDTDVDIEDLDVNRTSAGCNVGPSNGSLTAMNTETGFFTYVHNGSETTKDSFTYCATDGTANSSPATVYIDITPDNDAPTISGFSGTTPYTENDGATVIDSDLSLADVDDSNLNSATVSISPYDTGNDILVCGTTSGGITCNQSGATLTLSHASSTTIANFQSTLRSVTYRNSSDNPNGTDRTITVTVNDGDDNSNQPTKTIGFTAVNDLPVAVDDGAAGSGNAYVSVGEGGTVVSSVDITTNDTDLDLDSLDASRNNSLCTGGTISDPVNGTLDAFSGAAGTFTYTHDGSDTTADSFTYCAFDGTAYSTNLATVYIEVTAVNDIPVVSGFSGTTAFTEQTPVVVDSSIILTDSDSTDFNSAQVQIDGPEFVTGVDTLSCTLPLPGGITTCSFSPSTGILSISGSSTVANYESALEGVVFSNTSENPNTATKNISLLVRDQLNAASVTANKSITIARVNDVPIAVNDGAAGTGNGYINVDESGTVDNGTDTDGTNNDLASNDTDPDSVSLDASRTSCPAGVSGPSNGVVSNFGADGTFTYQHNGSDTTSDSFTYCTFDGTAYSLTSASVFIDINSVNDAPVITGFSGTTGFNEQTLIVLDGDITLSDSESSNLDSALLAISANYENGSDILSCALPLPAGISSCVFNAAAGTLTLSGTASIANYESALESVRFNNDSENPQNTNRTIQLSVEDQNDSLFSSIVSKTVTITRLNDAPTIASLTDQETLENTTADPNTFTLTAVASDVDVDDDTNTGDGSLTYSLTNAPTGMTISNAAGNPGEISWQPPQTGTFDQVYGPITVEIEDGDEESSAPNSTSFSVTVSPPDDDDDLVANYNDFCLTVSDSTNADNDGDGTAGTDGADATSGGDVCDSDDDNDQLPDTYEIANGLDPFDETDAAADADGDGVSNLDEFLAGTNPNFANLTIDATGYFTPYVIAQPDPTTIHPDAIAVSNNNPGPYRPGRQTITWIASNSSNSSLATSDQTLDIRPLINWSADQVSGEDNTVTVTASLNGTAPIYPVILDYSVSGTADSNDHNAVAGSLQIDDPEKTASFDITINSDSLSEGQETIIITLDDVNHAAIGMQSEHTITIVEENVAPNITLRIEQNGLSVSSGYVSDGTVTITATITDPNNGQSHQLDWSGTNNSLVAPTDTATTSWTFAPAIGNYLISVNVTDNGSPARSKRVSRLLNISNIAPVLQNTDDSDNDGNDDMAEGLNDSDVDGIPDYLDATSAPSESNLIPNQTTNLSSQYLIETEAGLQISIGSTASAANSFGAVLTNEQIEEFGSEDGSAPQNADDNYDHIGGIYDFEVRGLMEGDSINIVIPLQSAIPNEAEYRKFNAATGWSSFVEDANNAISSAVGELGACPEPGSNEYRSGLNYLDNCLQLRIEDGGANDTDNSVNGVVKDPGAIGVRLEDPVETGVEEGSGRLDLLLLLGLLGLLVLRNPAIRKSIK